MNEDGATPVDDQTVDQPIQEETDTLAPNENYEPDTDLVSQPVPESTDEPAGDNAQVEGAPAFPEEEEDETPFTQAQLPEVPNLSVDNYYDSEGNFRLDEYQRDQLALQQQVIQRSVAEATAQIRMEREYEKQWQKAEEKYPELKANKQLRSMVKAIHVDSPNNGKYLSPLKSADQIMGMLGKTKSQGMQQAQETRRTQAAAQLAVSNPPTAVTSDKVNDYKARMKNPTSMADLKSAQTDYLTEMIERGVL